MYIIAQIIGFVAFLVSLITYHKKSKTGILNNALISNSLKLIHYLLLGAYSGCVTKVIAIVRDVFIIMKVKYSYLNSKVFLYLFVLLYIIVSVITFDVIISLLPILAALSYIVVIWDGDVDKIRKVALIGYLLWLGYDFFVFSIGGILSNVVSILSVGVAIYNDKR